MAFLDDIKNRIMIFDGSMGTMLQRNGLSAGECPEEWNITHPEVVKNIYSAYLAAGSDVIQTNTFQSNRMKLMEYGLEDKLYQINHEAVRLAKEATAQKGYVAASIGPLGKLLEPLGELSFASAYETFKEQVIALKEAGADIISFETFIDVCEMRIALLAAKENCDLPVICSMSYEQNGKTLMGTSPEICAVILHSLGADLIGTNCSFGAEHMLKISEKYAKTGLPYSMKPNAGLPRNVDEKLVYDETPQSFASYALDFVKNGARLIGGCCGSNPEFIAALKNVLSGAVPIEFPLNIDSITSASQAIAFDALPKARMGRLNVDQEIRKTAGSGDMGCVADRAMDLLDEEWDFILLDFCPEDASLLPEVLKEAQTYLKQPFIFKTDAPEALEKALRFYKGRAGVLADDNERMAAAIKKYGAVNIRTCLVSHCTRHFG